MKPNVLLVTGGTGFLGTPLLARLASRGDTLCYVPTRHAGMRNRANVKYVPCDLATASGCKSIQEISEEVDGILHLAAAIPRSSAGPQDPWEMETANVATTLNLLSVGFPNLRWMLYSSSVDVYGTAVSLPITEEHPTNPTTFYGASKLAGEKYLRIACAARGIPLTILRVTQLYGPGEPLVKVIPSFIQRICQNQPPVIFGDGSDLRTYLFVEDAVRCILLALDARKDGIFNVSGGQASSVREVAEILLSLSGKTMQVEFRPRVKPPSQIVLANDKANLELGFEPAYTLTEGLRMELEHAAVANTKSLHEPEPVG
jgi:UDP-glucose 4-epimerase